MLDTLSCVAAIKNKYPASRLEGHNDLNRKHARMIIITEIQKEAWRTEKPPALRYDAHT
jgi:hypothetical protein